MRGSSRAGVSCVRAGTPAPVERSSQQVRAPRVGRCSDSSISAASERSKRTDRQTTLLVRTEAPIHDPAWTVDQLSLEDLVLAYMGRPASNGNHRPALEVLR
jgi:hypothetical protein